MYIYDVKVAIHTLRRPEVDDHRGVGETEA
jgi:hypothetical protein